jgi:hypothetical protein
LFAALTLLLNLPELTRFWRSPYTESFDGMSHLVVGEYYARNIFPRTWGWAPLWFGGMPFPDFYPPLFYFVTASLSRVLPFSYAVVVKTLLCGLSLTLPGLTASVARAQTQSWWAAGSAGCLTAILLSYEHYPYGIAIDSTLRSGLFTQLPAYVCLLVWQHYFLKARESARSRFLAKFFLFLLLLSNAHVAPIAMLFIVIAGLFEIVPCIRDRNFYAAINSLRFYAGLVFMPLAAAAFWYMPLLSHSEYLVTMTMPAMPVAEVSFVWIVPCGLTCIALLMSVLRKDRVMRTVALVCIFVALTSTAAFARIFPSLPLQPFRLFASFCFLSCIPIGYLFGCLAHSITTPSLRCVAFLVLLSPFAWDLAIDKAAAVNRSAMPPVWGPGTVVSSGGKMVKDGALMNVEIPSSLGDFRYLALNSLLSNEGVGTTYIALRESSVSSIFMTPLRNGLSSLSEVWGIETFLGFDPDFLSQSLDTQLDRADYMGANQFAASSSRLSEALEKSGRAVRERNIADWRIYKLAQPSMRAQVLQMQPAVFFGPVTFKKRSTWSYDYVRLQEEIFFQGRFDTLVARAQDMFLDTSPDLDRFSIAIMTSYRYHDLERAYARVKQYAESNTIICIRSNDPLFERLAADANASNHIYIFERLNGGREDIQPLRKQMQAVLSLLATRSRSIAAAKTQRVRSVHIGNQAIEVVLTNRTDQPLPVLIKSSYFPYWYRSDSKEPVYMVTPTYMLTFAKSDIALQFSADASVWIGFSVSFAAVLLGCAAWVRSAVTRRRKSGHSSHPPYVARV